MPLVTMLVPTYGRYPKEAQLLEEKVYWFLRQRGGIETELLIFNDSPAQKLSCSAPGVRVVNAPQRYPSLGDKYNAMLALAKGDIILCDEDDDISLPNRVEESVARLKNYDYWNPQKTFFEGVPGPPRLDSHGVNHNTSAYRKGLFAYRSGNDQDMWADIDAKAAGRIAPPGDVRVYVYRFGISSFHLSGMGGAWNKVGPVTPGEYEIEPKMYFDYSSLAG